MRKEAQIFIIGALVLSGCAPLVAQAQESDTATPHKVDFTPTPNTFPTKIVIPTMGIEITPTPKKDILPFLYFSQTDKKYASEKTIDNCTWGKSACGIMVGAMVSRMDPLEYSAEFLAYFADKNVDAKTVFNCEGASIERHVEFLESPGHDFQFKKLSTPGATVDEVKKQIKDYTSQGIPVWVATDFWDNIGKKYTSHQSMAVGIDENGNIIFNDPYYGEGVSIPDSKLHEVADNGNEIWKVYAVIPPNN